MPSIRLVLSLAGVLLSACRSESRNSQPPPPDFAKAFSNLPLPRDPELVSRAGSADALQLTVHSPAGVDEVTEYYRTVLSNPPWRLVSDAKNPDGSTVLYAEHNGPPLWVRIWKLGDRGTMVELTGTVVAKDTTKAKPAAPKAPSTQRSDG
jgi:hypothetical protein